ncbi:hypothetical protein [Methylicorpusculum sp.]|uniref:hypothetical protein n=1 Tax=Methylicorpusculum sp. TaxID=2713644 RepID=UPI00271CDFF7|nr:hypothetical protein [Methylicorpusculum sp.]MDO8845986.1 hypothetical protein [Methylicorpusculum sp.]MDP2177115.1 hypothetical protein [Methylicorpusculum sp.]MDP3531257.1 hypothetical protein [Methylicorpusculum sp.]MDZ4153077.1 hypothetical protein [Methylicorpusculum sp.]
MIAPRYSLPVIGLLLVALIPTVIHNYLGLQAKDDAPVENIPTTLDNFVSKPSSRLAIWGKETFNCHDWMERMYTDETGQVIRLFVGKSFDHKRLYHHPELALSYGNNMVREGVQWLEGDQKIPVNVLRNNNKPGLAAYVLWYDGQFIENPIKHQIKDTLELLVSPKKPMTLFYVSDGYSQDKLPFQQTQSAGVLLKAIHKFVESAK